ncbi:helix-turn-helix domain-containing protein [Porphyromonas bennonis]|uniref:helix-turn-helix domain-containing protein n=1 Tax=Porphyromonas bennonis TaxID=501496 RepID=UPI000365B838|nr:helix-turn-helix domain-containing protein [Porphyromonas bennonis]
MKTTKETILRESFKLFLAKGYDGTSVPDIERAAMITRGAIFHHFVNKYIRKNETYSENKNKTYILRGELRG